MTDDSPRLAGVVDTLQLHDQLQSLAYFPLPFLASLPPIPPPWGNVAFEVNIICFVALLWWLNNGLLYAAKWESEAGDGSNLAFLPTNGDTGQWRLMQRPESFGRCIFTAPTETASVRLPYLNAKDVHSRLWSIVFKCISFNSALTGLSVIIEQGQLIWMQHGHHLHSRFNLPGD